MCKSIILVYYKLFVKYLQAFLNISCTATKISCSDPRVFLQCITFKLIKNKHHPLELLHCYH